MSTKNHLPRREFLKNAVMTSCALPLLPYAIGKTESNPESKDRQLTVHIFSKHLQFLDYQDMAAAAAEIGFNGVELTVRPKGHVLPENAVRDLPRAVEAVRAANLVCDMIVTRIDDAKDPLTRPILETAADLGIKYYRLGYFRYPKEGSLPGALKGFHKEMKQIAAINRKLDLTAVYQNHAGNNVGSSMWELWQLLHGIKADFAGCQYDIRHAVVEGGRSWEKGLRLIRNHIRSIVIKDFKWVLENGQWKLLNTPLGEGMVDFPTYFRLLKEYAIDVPVTVHYEYSLGGANHGDRHLQGMTQKQVLAAMKKDLDWLRETWKSA